MLQVESVNPAREKYQLFWRCDKMTEHCCDCDDFENRCYYDGSIIGICNKRHEVVDPEDNCEKRDKIYQAWLKRCGR